MAKENGKLDLHVTANNKAKLKAFVLNTMKSYVALDKRLQHTAAMVLYHAAEYRECSALNIMLNNLKVNDQTALRVWVGSHATIPNPDSEVPLFWIKYNKEKGFYVVKGVVSEGLLDLDKLADENFRNRNVRDKDAVTLETLLAIIENTVARVKRIADKEDIALPETFEQAINSVDREAKTIHAHIIEENKHIEEQTNQPEKPKNDIEADAATA